MRMLSSIATLMIGVRVTGPVRVSILREVSIDAPFSCSAHAGPLSLSRCEPRRIVVASVNVAQERDRES